ncbi:hypothetical protein ACL7TT_00500 [Microbulbifer sp. 2304DJ12-6]
MVFQLVAVIQYRLPFPGTEWVAWIRNRAARLRWPTKRSFCSSLCQRCSVRTRLASLVQVLCQAASVIIIFKQVDAIFHDSAISGGFCSYLKTIAMNIE